MNAPQTLAAVPEAGTQDAERPLRAGMQPARIPAPMAMVIFGATGDLTRRKLMPALFRLDRHGLLPDGFAVVGMSRDEMSDAEFAQRMRAAVEEFDGPPEPAAWDRFAERLTYLGSGFADEGAFVRLAECLHDMDAEHGTAGNRLFYLAIPPRLFGPVIRHLGQTGLVYSPADERFSRVVVEKPFGRDLESACALNAEMLSVFDEPQIFRIDHYLGKETVQNLLVFRFANVIWEPIWNRNYVDHVQLTVAESVGIGRRAGYYENAGALRDMVQSHLLQVFTLVAMEPPASYDADAIRSEKVKVLSAVRPIPPDAVATETARGQYGPGVVGASSVDGYCEEPGVADDSQTETYAALRLQVDNWRWAGVPFYLRTGKRLPERTTEISIHFRPAPHPILDLVDCDLPEPNVLVLHIQPEEGISLKFEAKVPGLAGRLHPVSMDFTYQTAFTEPGPDAYERLLLDAMLGDATLFTRRDEVETAWALITPILQGWVERHDGSPERYAAGSWGPPGADQLLAADGRSWRQPDA